jgi:sugar lactone lactonase YvrE
LWSPFLSQISVSGFYISNGKMMIYDGASSVYLVNESFNVSLIENIGEVPDAEYDTERGLCWFAGKAKGVLSYNTKTTTVETYKPMGPATNVPWDMKFAGQKLFVVQGGRWASEFGKPGYVMMYENGEWLNLDPKDIKAITQNEVLDFVNVAVDPDDNKHFFVTSYGTGLYEFKNNKFENKNSWYNNLNSSLETILQNEPFRYIRLDGAVFDSNKNLFMTNSYVSGGVQIRLANGTWTKLTNPEFFKPTLGKILISKQNPNQKWIPSVRYTPGYIVFDDNGTLENQDDDKVVFRSSFVFIETDNGQTNYISANPTSVNTIVEDLNGVIWVGTELGPFQYLPYTFQH